MAYAPALDLTTLFEVISCFPTVVTLILWGGGFGGGGGTLPPPPPRGNAKSTGRSGRQKAATPTQHAKGRTGDCPGPRKGATTGRNVTQGDPFLLQCTAILILPGGEGGGGVTSVVSACLG